MKTDVVIIGAGPAGLFLGHLLARAGIGCITLERQSRAHVEARIRAGILERTTTDLLDGLGLGGRMKQEGIVHNGFCIADGDRLIRISIRDLTGHHVTAYGQTEITKDLLGAAEERGLRIVWQAEDVALHDIHTERPFVTFHADGADRRIDARFVAGCDGFHGPSRRSIPASQAREFERVYPFGWLGVLADVPPCNDEVIYANHERGFALASMRSYTRSRYYIQTPIDEAVEAWSDEMFWDELCLRLGREAGARVTRGPSIEKSIAPLRSYVFEPMRWGSLFLAGDAAHIVPPTGAKGLNLASSDVAYLSEALIRFFSGEDKAAIERYSERALARVWKAERFSWYLTGLLHRFPDASPFERRMQQAELDYIAASPAMQTALAENYVGLPL